MAQSKKAQCYLCSCDNIKCLLYSPRDDAYFCTGGCGVFQYSHIVFVLRKYGAIPLLKGETKEPLICSLCKGTNPFKLGYFKGSFNMKSLICDTCLVQNKRNKGKIYFQNLHNFVPIFSDSFVDSEIAAKALQSESIVLDENEFSKRVKALRANRGYRIRISEYIDLTTFPSSFIDTSQYLSALLPFINEEENVSMIKVEEYKYNDIMINFDDSSYKAFQFHFHANNEQSRAMPLGTRVVIFPNNHFNLLNYDGAFNHRNKENYNRNGNNNNNNDNDDDGDEEEEQCLGLVAKKSRINEITIMVTYGNISDIFTRGTNGKKYISLKVKASDIPFDRQRWALQQFARNNFFINFFCGNKSVLDINEESDFEINVEYCLPNMKVYPNKEQMDAVKYALTHKFTMIQGPPGTGKSTCIALQAQAFYENGNSVLVVTHSNAAADHLAEIMIGNEMDILRVPGSSYEIVASFNKILAPYLPLTILNADYSKYLGKEENWSEKDTDRYRISIHNREKDLIRNTKKIVIATSTTSGGGRFEREFQKVIVDESNQLLDPELLIPLARRCNQLTLYGDQKQIGPYVNSNRSRQLGYGKSIMERLTNNAYDPICLVTQYRMHPVLSKFPSIMFYNGRLVDGISAKDRPFGATKVALPSPQKPFVYYNVHHGREQISPNGKSFLNIAEATTMIELVIKLYQSNIQPNQIAVITFYNGMIDFLRENLTYISGLPIEYCNDIRIDTVDAFEGSDIDYVILTCVRSNERKNIGFLRDTGRMNVALTRAKFALFVIGNAATFIKDEVWNHFIEHCKELKIMVDLE